MCVIGARGDFGTFGAPISRPSHVFDQSEDFVEVCAEESSPSVLPQAFVAPLDEEGACCRGDSADDNTYYSE